MHESNNIRLSARGDKQAYMGDSSRKGGTGIRTLNDGCGANTCDSVRGRH